MLVTHAKRKAYENVVCRLRAVLKLWRLAGRSMSVTDQVDYDLDWCPPIKKLYAVNDSYKVTRKFVHRLIMSMCDPCFIEYMFRQGTASGYKAKAFGDQMAYFRFVLEARLAGKACPLVKWGSEFPAPTDAEQGTLRGAIKQLTSLVRLG